MFRFLFKTLIALSLLLVVGVAMIVWFAIESDALVIQSAELSGEQIKRARALFAEHNPRKLKSGQRKTITLDERELDLILDHLLTRTGQGHGDVVLTEHQLEAKLTVQLPSNPLGRYLNVQAQLTETDALPRFLSARIGRVPIPAKLADRLFEYGLARIYARLQVDTGPRAIERVTLGDQSLSVTYHWRPEILTAVSAELISQADRERLLRYQNRLADLTREQTSNRISLLALLQPLMQLAVTHSSDGDPVAENRALVITLSTYISGRRLKVLIPEAAKWRQPRFMTVTLAGRRDLPNHLMTSAALALLGNSGIADAIGLSKEINDARSGSGFSFRDFTANRCGTLLGELAVTERTATELQRRVVAASSESDLLPEIRDLPENMTEAEFLRRFGGVGEPAYVAQVTEIERRIADLVVYQ